MIKNVISTALLALLSVASTSVTFAAVDSPGTQNNTPDSPPKQNLQSLINVFQEARGSIDKSQLDLAGLLDKLDYDHEKIVAFVKSDIYFEQYSGSLRGAFGTFLSRSGNSLDQSVLLAKMLKDAGFDARIAYTQLNQSDAKMLFQQSNSGVFDADSRLLENLLNDIISIGQNTQSPDQGSEYEADTKSRPEATPLIQHAETNAKSVSKNILKKMRDLDLESRVATASQELVKEAQEYFWVQLKTSANADWTDVHPAFRKNAPSIGGLKPLDYFYDVVPKEFVHMVSIQFFVDQRFGDELRTHALMDPYVRPAANLATTVTKFVAVPNGWNANNDSSEVFLTEESFEKSTLFYPVLNDAVPDGGRMFDLHGNSLPRDAAHFMAGIFAQVDRAMSSATAAISQMMNQSSEKEAATATELQSLWYQVVISAPNGQDKTIKRTIANKDWHASEAEFIAALSREVSISVFTGKLSDAFVINALIDGIDVIEDLLPIVDQINAGSSNFNSVDMSASDVSTKLARTAGILYAFFADNRGYPNPNTSYRSEANILARYRPTVPGGGAADTVDILNNTRRAFYFQDGNIQFDRQQLIEQGAFETHLEAALFHESAGLMSDLIIGSRAKMSLGNSILIDSHAELTRVGENLNTQMTRHLSDDLNNNYVIIASSPLTPESDRLAWWRINPVTGETLGMAYWKGRFGGASPLAEEIIEDTVLSAAFLKAMKGTGASIGCGFVYALTTKYAGAAAVGICTTACVKLGGDAELCGSACTALAGTLTTVIIGEKDKTKFLVRCIIAIVG